MKIKTVLSRRLNPNASSFKHLDTPETTTSVRRANSPSSSPSSYGDEFLQDEYFVEDDEPERIVRKSLFKNRLGKFKLIKPKVRRTEGSMLGKVINVQLVENCSLQVASIQPNDNDDADAENSSEVESPDGSETHLNDESEKPLLQVQIIEPKVMRAMTSIENHVIKDHASITYDFEVLVNGFNDNEELSQVRDTRKTSHNMNDAKFSPQECLDDIKSMENQVLIVNMEDKVFIDAIENINDEPLIDVNTGNDEVVFQQKEEILHLRNSVHNKRTKSFKQIEEWCVDEFNGMSKIVSSFMKNYFDEGRKKSKIVQYDDDNSSLFSRLREIGTELQYKTPCKKNKKQTTVVLPSHDRSYCEVLTASPNSTDEYMSFQFNEFVTNNIHSNHRKNDRFAQNDFTINSQVAVTPKMIFGTKKLKSGTNSWFKSKNTKSKMINSVSDNWANFERTENQKMKDNDSVGDFFTDDSFALKEVTKTNVIVQNDDDSWFKAKNYLNPFKKVDKMMQYDVNDSIDEILSNADGCDFADVKETSGNVKEEVNGMKQNGTNDSLDEILSSADGCDFADVKETNGNDEEGTGDWVKGDTSVSSCQLTVNMNNVSPNNNELPVETPTENSPSAVTSSSQKIVSFSNVLLSETAEVIQTIENMVKKNIQNQPDQAENEDVLESTPTDSSFHDVLKSMVREIILGQSPFKKTLKQRIIAEDDDNAPNKTKGQLDSTMKDRDASNKTPAQTSFTKRLKEEIILKGDNVASSPVDVIAFPSSNEKQPREIKRKENNNSWNKHLSKIERTPVIKGEPSISERIVAIQRKLQMHV